MADIHAWLEGLGLGDYTEAFEAERIEFGDLARLDAADLKEMGLPIGPRKRVLEAIAALIPDATTSAGAGGQDAALQKDAHRDAERRQLTVMFCDMVGFTELASRVDPEILQKIIRVYEDTCAAAITRYDGYVFQRLGDGIVAFFGYPLAHEGEAERAIRAGLDIVDAFSNLDVDEVGQLHVRIGIATGLVVVASAEKGAVGETMNLASRLQGIAQVDTIVVSERVRQLAGGSFEYQDMGKQTLKGITRSTHAYGIVGVSDAASRFEAASGEELTPLVGRELELGLLMDRWALAQDGEGQVVLLSGEPGIGKSRILSALRDKLQGEGAQAMRFQCSPYYINSAFWPSIDNFERALKFARDESPESKLDKLEALIVGHYQLPLADVRFIGSMLSIPCDERYGEFAMTPQKFKDETLRTLVDITEAAARKQPSVMLFEDAHWADPTTLEVLDLMIDRVKAMPLLIVLTHRPEFQNRWADHGHVSALNLSKLTRAQSSAMVSRVTAGKALPPELLEQILVKTDGVPLFVEELTKSILESGELTKTGDHYEYAGKSHSVTIPATLRDSLMARLDRFMPVKEIAQIGAAIGREFSYELVSAVAPLSTTQLDDALAQLTDSGLAFRRGTPPEATYTFKHALVQDAAYDSLLKSRRQELHAKIAKVIDEHFPQTRDTEPELLAHHLSAAGQTEAAIPLWQKAGELALGHMALAEAISHLKRGMELIETLPASVERDANELALRIPLGTAWMAFKGWPAPEVWTSFHPALPLAHLSNDARLLARTLWGLWVNTLTQGQVGESLSWAEELLESAEERKDEELFFTANMAAMATHFWLGNLLQAKQHGDLILSRYDASRHAYLVNAMNHDPKTLTDAYASHWEWMLGWPDQAAAVAEERDANARTIGHPFDRGFALTVGSHLFEYRGDAEGLFCSALDAERLGRDNSLPLIFEVLAQCMKGVSRVKAGRAEEGITYLQPGLQAWEAAGAELWSPYIKSILAEAYSLTGDIDDALQLIDEQVEQVERPGWEERVHYAEIMRLKGWMLTLKDDLAGAEENYLASLDWAREQKSKSWELRTSTSLARLWQSQGKNKEAHDLLAPVYEWFTEGFDTRDLKDAKALLEELAA